MASEFTLPDLGEGIHEAEVISVLIKEGETVKEDQPILEVETDKAMVEIPSPFAGVVEKIHVKQGETVKVGRVMVTFAGSSTAPKKASEESKAKAAPEVAKATPQAKMPVSTAGGNGKPVHIEGPVPATPATRRLARELQIDLRQIHGSGPAGRVLKEDVMAWSKGGGTANISGPAFGTQGFAAQGFAAQAFAAPARVYDKGKGGEPFSPEPLTSQPIALPDFTKYGQVERIPLRSIRRKIALNMAQSWSHIPHVTHFDECDVSQLNESLSRHEKAIAQAGGKLTLTVVALKAIVSGLKRYPQFNSSLDEATGEIVLKHYYNIGIAVATERGLIVPVIRNVEQKSIMQLAVELADIAKKTREGKVELDRLQGGTFTITNIGAIGGTGMVPMVNYPECAILGMARAVPKPVVRDGIIQVRTIMPLALSFDHRLADGAEAAYFVRHIKDCLEYPLALMLE